MEWVVSTTARAARCRLMMSHVNLHAQHQVLVPGDLNLHGAGLIVPHVGLRTQQWVLMDGTRNFGSFGTTSRE